MRKVKEYFSGRETKDGAGVRLRRCFGYHQTPKFDPFLLMDFFDSDNPEDYKKGFPWHPHRGIETITYLISGEIEHEDSLGNKDVIRDGECQWMSAGSGILHQEMPKDSDHMLGSQIWLNMPKGEKMNDPEYEDITGENIGRYEEEGIEVKIIGGEYKGVKGPIERKITNPTYLDVKMDGNKEFTYEIEDGYRGIIFLMRGRAIFDQDELVYPQGVLYEDEGDRIVVRTGDGGARFLLLAGKPLEEDIAWRGPIVMNTIEELDLAFKELKEDSFIK